MDELKLLRDWDAETKPPREEARLAARERLLAAARAATPATDHAPAEAPRRARSRLVPAPLRRPGPAGKPGTAGQPGTVGQPVGGGKPGARGMSRRTAVRTLVAAGATAAAVGTPVALLRRDETPRPAVAGAVVLRRAARLERRREQGRPPVEPRPGQYVYSRTVVRSTADDTGKSRTFGREDWMASDRSRPSWLTRGGTGDWESPEDKGESWPPTDWRALSRVPTEPAELLRYTVFPFEGGEPVRMPPGEFGRSEWQTVFERLSGLSSLVGVLADGLLPALLGALAEFPGLVVEGGAVDARGREAVAVTYEHGLTPGPPVDSPVYLLFAPDTYEYLGVRKQVYAGPSTSATELSFLDAYAVVDEVKQRP